MMQAQTNKFYLKILAFLAAVILWFVVITVENSVYAFPDPIQVNVVNLGKSLSLSEPLPKVKIYLGADKESTKGISLNDFDVYVDLKDQEAGEHTVNIIAQSKNEKARVLKIEPSQVSLKLSPLAEKEVDVVVIVKGSPAPNYVIGETKTETAKAKIRGAQAVLDRISMVEAELVLDGTQTSEVSQNVTLQIPLQGNLNQDIVVIEPEQLLVTATIASDLSQKEVEVIPGFATEDDHVAWEGKLAITPLKVIIQGSATALEDMSEIKTAPLEISALTRNGSVNTELELPEGVTTIIPQQKVTVTVINKNLPESEFLNVEPTP